MKVLAVATAMASSLRLGAGAAALERGPLYYYHGLLEDYRTLGAAVSRNLEYEGALDRNSLQSTPGFVRVIWYPGAKRRL